MTKTAHTPGPWKVERLSTPQERYVIKGGGFDLACTFGQENQKADVFAMAAAPELLAAADMANESAQPTEDGRVSISSAAFDALLRAIAKAQG